MVSCSISSLGGVLLDNGRRASKCTPCHGDQLYLAEFVAVKARQRLFHIDLDVEARNSVVVQAAKLQNCSFEEAADLQDDRPRFEFEDVGGACGDDVENPDEKQEKASSLFKSPGISGLTKASAL